MVYIDIRDSKRHIMEWFKKHTDTVIVIGAILGAVVWMNSEFNQVRKDINDVRNDLSIIKTVLILKGIMPECMVTSEVGDIK